MRNLLIALTLVATPTMALAQVQDAGPEGFATERTVMIQAAPEVVWSAFLEIGRWWHPDHTISGSSANLRLEPRALGCFCESLPSGGEFLHMQLVFLDPPQIARFVGGLGPLQEHPVAGAMTWTFGEFDNGTMVTLTYRVHGRGIEEWAVPVEDVLHQQLQRLARLVEQGSPE